MNQMDHEIGDVHTDMVDIAVEIQHELSTEILHWSSTLIKYSELCSQLDW